MTNLDEYSDIGTHLVALYVQNVTYFNSFGVEYISKEMRTFIENENKKNIFRTQAYNSIMCGHFCIECVDFMLCRKDFN